MDPDLVVLLAPYRDWIIPVVALLLLLVAIVFAISSALTARANRRLVAALEAQARYANRPLVVVQPVIDPVTMVVFLRIANIGRASAENLELSMNKPFHQFADRQRSRNIAAFHAFNNILPSFAPGQELAFHLGTAAQIFGDRRDEDLTPSQFKVTARYLYEDALLEEETTIDLRQLHMSASMATPLRQELFNINKTLQEMASLWKSSSIGGGEEGSP